ncbi:Uncharacterized protein EJ110_NYTH10564 [Nymphaea thermarum]|nr:Uncharacterized protein EJ110_NYTH10564 [Nymphaea thermarum]
MAPRKAKTIEPETLVVEGEQVVVEETRIVERGESSGTNSKLDLILSQVAGVNQTIANIDGRLNTLEQRRVPPRSHTSSYYRRNDPIGVVSEAFLVDARRASLRGQGMKQPPRAQTHVPPNEPIPPPIQRQIVHPQFTNGTHQPGATLHVRERARREGERPTPEEIRRAFLEQRQNQERQHHDEPYQNLGPHHEGPRRHHKNWSMQSMTFGEFEEELSISTQESTPFEKLLGTKPQLENLKELKKFIYDIGNKFFIKDLGGIHNFLGLELNREANGLLLSQHKYITDLLKRGQMEEAKAVVTPAAPNVHLSKFEGDTLKDGTLYISIVAFAVNKTCQFLHEPTYIHWTHVKQILHYLQGIQHVCLHIKIVTDWKLEAFSDADWAGCPDDRRSTSGFITTHGGNIIS